MKGKVRKTSTWTGTRPSKEVRGKEEGERRERKKGKVKREEKSSEFYLDFGLDLKV